MKQQTMTWWIGLIVGLMLWTCGCTEQQARSTRRSPDLSSGSDEAVARRFQEGSSHSQSVVQSAVELSEKYSALSEEAAALRQGRHELEAENAALKLRIEVLEKDLSQCQQELNDTNSLLMEMLGELNKWKSDVLDYRNEMRDSAKAQMKALIKILELMGAEVDETAPTQEGTP